VAHITSHPVTERQNRSGRRKKEREKERTREKKEGM
jgi:hypothetical protein